MFTDLENQSKKKKNPTKNKKTPTNKQKKNTKQTKTKTNKQQKHPPKQTKTKKEQQKMIIKNKTVVGLPNYGDKSSTHIIQGTTILYLFSTRKFRICIMQDSSYPQKKKKRKKIEMIK